MFYYDHQGRLQSLPTRWTDVDAPDVFIVQAAGRAYFRPADLWAVVQLIEALQR